MGNHLNGNTAATKGAKLRKVLPFNMGNHLNGNFYPLYGD
jgi:hypothetical protein